MREGEAVGKRAALGPRCLGRAQNEARPSSLGDVAEWPSTCKADGVVAGITGSGSQKLA